MNLALADMMDDKNENVGYINFEFYRHKPCVNNIYKAFLLCFLRFIPAYCKKWYGMAPSFAYYIFWGILNDKPAKPSKPE